MHPCAIEKTVQQRREGVQVEDVDLGRDVTKEGKAEQSMGKLREEGAMVEPTGRLAEVE